MLNSQTALTSARPCPLCYSYTCSRPFQRALPEVQARKEGGPSPRAATNWLVDCVPTLGISAPSYMLPVIPSTLEATFSHHTAHTAWLSTLGSPFSHFHGPVPGLPHSSCSEHLLELCKHWSFLTEIKANFAGINNNFCYFLALANAKSHRKDASCCQAS